MATARPQISVILTSEIKERLEKAAKNEARVAEGQEKVATEKRTKETVKNLNDKTKKSTMGDLESLTKLKADMDAKEAEDKKGK